MPLKSSPASVISLTPREFNSYGSRRGNDAIMARGTFANIRLLNKFLNKQAPQTVHLPSGETVSTISLLSETSVCQALEPGSSQWLSCLHSCGLPCVGGGRSLVGPR